jgi:hypothetical protein
MAMSVIVILGVQIPKIGGCAWLAIILVHMMVVIAPAESKTKNESAKEILNEIDSFFLKKLLVLNKEDWSLCMASSLFFLE